MASDNGDGNDNDTPTKPVSLATERAKRKRTDAPPIPDNTGPAQIESVAPQLLANLRDSCLTDETIAAARLFAEPATGARRFGFRLQPGQGAALFFPYRSPHARAPDGYRIRPLRPTQWRDARTKKLKTKKYDQLKGTGLLVYTPPLASTLDALRSLDVPLYWTEGEKKALYLAQQGLCVVGLSGVDCWHDTQAKERGDGRILHEYIREHYAIAGRAHVIVFDADAREKPEVIRAMSYLAGALGVAGAASVHACLPPLGPAKGIDDYAKAHGDEATMALLANQREPIDELAPDEGCLPLTRFRAFEGSGAKGLRLPRGYDCERDGTVTLYDDVSDVAVPVLDAPMAVVGHLVDERSELNCLIAFRDTRGQWKRIPVPRAVLGDRGMLAALRPYGAALDTTNLTHAIRYLAAFERDNGERIEQVKCVTRAGWYEGQFMLDAPVAQRGAERLELAVPPDRMRPFKALAPARGADVKAHVAALTQGIQASDTLALLVFASLAAPMLRVLGLPNFAMHLCGDSSRGKTSMLRMAASVYGDPFDPSWVASWNATAFAVEHRAALLCDLPLFFDELGASNAQDTDRLIYMLCNGESRGRAGKDLAMREALSWHTVVLSTGERELADAQSNTGAQARVLNMPVAGMGELGAEEIETMVAACAAQHGAFGRAWIAWLVDMDDATRAELRAAYAVYTRALRAVAEQNGDRLGARMAAYYAVMQLAESQANAWWGLGLEDGETVARSMAERSADVELRVKPVAERVLEVLRAWVAGERASFPSPNDVTGESRNIAGYVRSDGLVGFLRPALVRYLASHNLTWTVSLARELASTGVLHTDPNRRLGARFWVGGEQVSVVALRLSEDD